MRKFLTILSALILGLLITMGIFWIQGKSLTDVFKKDETTINPGSIPSTETPPKELNLTYTERLTQGDTYFKQEFYSMAANEYAKAALLAPNELTPYLKLVQTHLKLRNYEKALANTEAVLKIDPNNTEAKFDKILIQIKLSDFSGAKALIDAYPPETPESGQILYYQGILTSLFNNHELAKSTLNDALQKTTDPDLKTRINRVKKAYEEFGIAQAADELYLKILLAKSLNENQEYEMAIHLLKEVLKARPDLRDGWILLGFAYLNLQNYQFALTAFDKAYSLDVTWSTTQYFLGLTHKELGNPKEAITYFSAALTGGFKPEVVIQNHLADLYFETKEYKKATEAYEAVLEVNKQDVNAFVRPVWLYLDYLNEPQKGLTLAQTAVNTFPESAMSYNLLGWSYIGMGDYKNAEANLKRALALDPTLAAGHLNLGQLNEKWGKTDLALQSYQAAYNIDKNGSIGNLAAQHYNKLLKKSLSEGQ